MADFSWVPEELEGTFSYLDKKLVASCEICGATKQTAGKGAVLRQVSAGKVDRFRFCSIHGDFSSAKPSKEDIATWPVGHKRCRRCLKIKPFDEFHKHKDCLFGVNVECKACRQPVSKEKYSKLSFEQRLLDASKSRARRHGLTHTLSLEDIIIPNKCPVLGMPIVLEKGHDYAPSLDQRLPRGGYTKENVIVMSRRANILKNNMTLDEAKRLYEFLSGFR